MEGGCVRAGGRPGTTTEEGKTDGGERKEKGRDKSAVNYD